VILEEGRRTGHNTDVPGISAALRERYDGPVGSAVVVGGGATAASAILGLADLGCRRVTLFVRDVNRAGGTVETAARHPRSPEVEVRPIGAPPEPADVLVSTIPAAAQGAAVLALAEPVRAVFDVIYDPWPTPLARDPRPDTVLVSGLDLLVHQAALQVELMTGTGPAPLDAMRRAGEAALAERVTSSGDPLP
jgi:shikimate dehydrogenase